MSKIQYSTALYLYCLQSAFWTCNNILFILTLICLIPPFSCDLLGSTLCFTNLFLFALLGVLPPTSLILYFASSFNTITSSSDLSFVTNTTSNVVMVSSSESSISSISSYLVLVMISYKPNVYSEAYSRRIPVGCI